MASSSSKSEKQTVLTLFSTPKPFEGHTGIIQRNAIMSWTLLTPRPQIILFGDGLGTAEICAELGLTHVPTVSTTESGAPFLGDLFEEAERLAQHDLLAYVNCDIMLMNDFLEALGKISASHSRFLMVGLRWETAMPTLWDFSKPDWQAALTSYIRQNGSQPAPPGNSDYFVFPRGLWRGFARLAIGRGGVDPWLVYEARRLGAAVVDTSEVLAIHQNHDSTANFKKIRQWRKELSINHSVVGKEVGKFCLWDATHILTRDGLRRPRGTRYLIRRVDTLYLRYPRFAGPLKITSLAAAQVRSLKERKSLAHNPLLRLFKLVIAQMPSDGICAILGMDDGSNLAGASCADGLHLAYDLTRVGSPVAVYDPRSSAMERAKELLAGPVKFATSAKDALSEADVIVLASKIGEFENLTELTPGNAGRPRVVIDCCGAYRPQHPVTGIEYIALAGG